ncbi:MAG TPA: VOC family protein, partial [Caldilineaceae bacterium]|nr:VOC family protein [Caldilineaceae bacterium]
MTIHPETKLGPVHLCVADLGKLSSYYTTLGLYLHHRQGKEAVLGDGNIGHIHLHEDSIASTEAFYRDALGFDLIAQYVPSATFLAAGGYHHHIGANTWAGEGIPAAPADSWGLSHSTIEVPGTQALGAVRAQVEAAGSRRHHPQRFLSRGSEQH